MVQKHPPSLPSATQLATVRLVAVVGGFSSFSAGSQQGVDPRFLDDFRCRGEQH
ncbi:hypothetical protein [Serratia symbiotica]|uniref:Uncharacterized protein n=1 Tax=Serratia symbiotica TaxID=138074 RepID=A0A7D5SFM8_9GAMM|nr:hypothetical protein [Serratia symbiotica]MBF1995528.1 hypothetical protein [Serratia symbiotica]MBQ0955844.1 hypothetical protein [Serratia symbiotica]QLH62172.1 hypothetical protein SYMBAF_03325 [Serratia symbiotica]QTP15076.1 hypothetical protein GPZ83_0003585 [Serratia symbiotica]